MTKRYFSKKRDRCCCKVFCMKKNYYAENRPEMLLYIPLDVKKILDVGCGLGNFGKLLKERNNQCLVYGIEKNPTIAYEASKNLDKVYTGDVIHVLSKIPDHYFEAVVFNDVLEHLIDPWTVMELISNKIVDRGIVVASIPNMRYIYVLRDLLINKEWKYLDAGILDKTHVRFFTIKSIKRLFEESGYLIDKIQGINGKVSWKWYLLNLLLFGKIEDTKHQQFAIVARYK